MRYHYDPYGLRAFHLPDPPPPAFLPFPAGSQGSLHDDAPPEYDAPGLVHSRHRYRHPTLGRWLAPDPLGYADGMNLYQAFQAAPASVTDPMGLSPEAWPTLVGPFAEREKDPWTIRAYIRNDAVFLRQRDLSHLSYHDTDDFETHVTLLGLGTPWRIGGQRVHFSLTHRILTLRGPDKEQSVPWARRADLATFGIGTYGRGQDSRSWWHVTAGVSAYGRLGGEVVQNWWHGDPEGRYGGETIAFGIFNRDFGANVNLPYDPSGIAIGPYLDVGFRSSLRSATPGLPSSIEPFGYGSLLATGPYNVAHAGIGLEVGNAGKGYALSATAGLTFRHMSSSAAAYYGEQDIFVSGRIAARKYMTSRIFTALADHAEIGFEINPHGRDRQEQLVYLSLDLRRLGAGLIGGLFSPWP